MTSPTVPTVVKLGGLVVALGLFSVGPGSTMVEELLAKATTKKKRQEKLESHLDTSPHAEELKRRYTNTPHPETNDFLSHPFQPVAAGVASGNRKNSTKPEQQQPAKPTSSAIPSTWLSFLGPSNPPKSSE